MGDLEAREYSDAEVKLVRAIWKYLKIGFKHKVAYQKALEDTGYAPPPRATLREAA